MPLEQILPYVPLAAIVAGVLLVLWNERSRVQTLVGGRRPSAETKLTPAERFDRLFALRTWCDQAGEADAVKALDGVVLPAIVRGGARS